MAFATFSSNLCTRSLSFTSLPQRNTNHTFIHMHSFTIVTRRTSNVSVYSCSSNGNRRRLYPLVCSAYGGGSGGPRGGGGGGGDGGGGSDDDAEARNQRESALVLLAAGRSLENLPKDLAVAIGLGKVPGSVVERYFQLEKSAVFRWLLQFGGFKERLLADDLFLTKVAIECGVGIFTKTAAELERRREKFSKELDFVCADVV